MDPSVDPEELPLPPFVAGSDASKDAADAVTPSEQRHDYDRILNLLYQKHPDGLTDQEIQAILPLGDNTERPRRVELRDKYGVVCNTGRRRVPSAGGGKKQTPCTIWGLTTVGVAVASGQARLTRLTN